MSLIVINSTSCDVYVAPAGKTDGSQDEEDEEDQSRNCEKHVEEGTSPCAWLQRPTFSDIPIAIGSPPDIHGGGIRRGHVARMVTGVVGSSDAPPPRAPAPMTTTIIRSRGARHGIRRVVRVRMDVRSSRFVRVWNVALDRKGRVLSAITYLFEIRRRPRGAGYATFRLIEREADQATPTARPHAKSAKRATPDRFDAAGA